MTRSVLPSFSVRDDSALKLKESCVWEHAAWKVRQPAAPPVHWRNNIRKVWIVCLLLSLQLCSLEGWRDWRLSIARVWESSGLWLGQWERTGRGKGSFPLEDTTCCAAGLRAIFRKVLSEGGLGPECCAFLSLSDECLSPVNKSHTIYCNCVKIYSLCVCIIYI